MVIWSVVVHMVIWSVLDGNLSKSNIFIKHSVWLGSLTLLRLPLPMPSIGAHRAAPCAPAAATPASVGSHHAGDIVPAPCASAAVTPASVGSHHAGDIVTI